MPYPPGFDSSNDVPLPTLFPADHPMFNPHKHSPPNRTLPRRSRSPKSSGRSFPIDSQLLSTSMVNHLRYRQRSTSRPSRNALPHRSRSPTPTRHSSPIDPLLLGATIIQDEDEAMGEAEDEPEAEEGEIRMQQDSHDFIITTSRDQPYTADHISQDERRWHVNKWTYTGPSPSPQFTVLDPYPTSLQEDCPLFKKPLELEWIRFDHYRFSLEASYDALKLKFTGVPFSRCWITQHKDVPHFKVPKFRHGAGAHEHPGLAAIPVPQMLHARRAYDRGAEDGEAIFNRCFLKNPRTGKLVYQLSHLCGVKNCANPQHSIVESGSANMDRVGCHSGKTRCMCRPRCLSNPGFQFIPETPGDIASDATAYSIWISVNVTCVATEKLASIRNTLNGYRDDTSNMLQRIYSGAVEIPQALVDNQPCPILEASEHRNNNIAKYLYQVFPDFFADHPHRYLRSFALPTLHLRGAIQDGCSLPAICTWLLLKAIPFSPGELLGYMHDRITTHPLDEIKALETQVPTTVNDFIHMLPELAPPLRPRRQRTRRQQPTQPNLQPVALQQLTPQP